MGRQGRVDAQVRRPVLCREKAEGRSYELTDFDTGEVVGTFEKSDLKQLKPNSGIRAMIGTALVQFQLTDPDSARRQAALQSIQRDPEGVLLEPLRASIDDEPDADLKAQKQRLERLLTIGYDTDTDARVAAIEEMSDDLGVDVRAALNPLVVTKRQAAATLPSDMNIAAVLQPDSDDLSRDVAYDLLVASDLAAPRVSPDDIRAALAANIDRGRVGVFRLRN